MFAPGVPELLADFHQPENLLASFVVSVYLLGFAFGKFVHSKAFRREEQGQFSQ